MKILKYQRSKLVTSCKLNIYLMKQNQTSPDLKGIETYKFLQDTQKDMNQTSPDLKWIDIGKLAN